MNAHTDDDYATAGRRGAVHADPGATARRWWGRALLASGRRRYAIPALVAGPVSVVLGIVLIATPPGGPKDAGAIPVATGPIRVVPSALPNGAQPSARLPEEPTEPPLRLSIPKLGVNTEVLTSTVNADGGLAIPQDPGKVGWWTAGAVPGNYAGNIVLAGHVDMNKIGPGALFKLQELPMGETIELRTTDHKYTYRAVARRSYPKQELPAELFAQTGLPLLVLVTCGGAFSEGHYADNVVVYAEPVGSQQVSGRQG